MNLKSVSDQLTSLIASVQANLGKGFQTAWTLLNYDLVENVFSPKKRIYIALEKDSLSIVYGSQFFGKSRINACRKYHFEPKLQDAANKRNIPTDGQPPKPDVIASTLDNFVNEYKAEHAKVILSIPKAWTVYRLAEFPAAVMENIQSVISYELDRLVSINAENAYYDFKIVSQTPENIKVAIAAARKDLINGYIEIIEEHGLSVQKVTTNLSAASGLLNHFYGKHGFVLLDVYADYYEIAGIKEGAVFYAHKERFSDAQKNEKSELLIEDLKLQIEALRQFEESIQVVVCGDEPFLQSLREHLDIPVHIMQRSNLIIEFQQETREADFGGAAGCLELAKGMVQSMNLLSHHTSNPTLQEFRFSLVLGTAAILFAVFSLFAPVAFEAVRIFQIEQKLDTYRDDFRKNEPQKNELDNIVYQLKATNEFKNSKPPRILLLKEISTIVPAQFWVSRIEISENTIEMEVQGKGAYGDVASVLESSPYFKNVRRADVPKESDEKGAMVESMVFKMELNDKPEDMEKK